MKNEGTKCEHNLESTSDTLARLRMLRLAKYGRWAPLFAGCEQLVDTALTIAEDAVSEMPARLDKVQRLRTHLVLRRVGLSELPLRFSDLASTLPVLARLAERELHIPGLTGIASAALHLVAKLTGHLDAPNYGVTFVVSDERD